MDPFQDDDQEQGGGLDIGELLRAFWRRKLLFLIPFILCLTMAGVAIKTMTPIYASSGQVMITVNATRSNLLDDPRSRYGVRVNDLNRVANQEIELLLTSNEFLDKIVMELDLQKALQAAQPPGEPPMSEDRAIRRARKRLRSMIKLRPDGDRLFRIEVRDPDPQRARDFAKVILERFVDEYRALQSESSAHTRDFLQRQLELYETDLRAAESRLNEFQSTLASAALADNPINAMNLGTVESNLRALRTRFNGQDAEELEQLAQSARAVIGQLPDITPYRNDPSLQAILVDLASYEADYQLHKLGTRDAQGLETQLGQLRVRLRSQIDIMVAQRLPTLGLMDRNRVSQFVYFALYRGTVDDVLQNLERYIREFRDFTSRQPSQSTRLAELQGDVDRARGLVDNINSEITQNNLNLAASASEVRIQIRIREMPELHYSPVEPNKVKLMALGLILSLGIGLGLVVLAILLDRSFRSVTSIERTLGLPVIGTLPMIQDEHFNQKRKFRVLRWITIIVGILAVGAVGFLVVYPRLG